MKLLYFTGSGNSLYVAKRIGGERHLQLHGSICRAGL